MNRTYRFNPLDRRNINAHAADGGRTGRVDAAHIQTGRMVYGRAWHPERRGVQALGRVPGMLHAAAYRQLRDEGRYGTASGIPEAERYQRHGNEYRIALVFHGEQGPLCIYPGRDDHLQGA